MQAHGLILGPDTRSSRSFARAFQQFEPGVRFDVRSLPDPYGHFDMYFVDHGLGDDCCMLDLLNEIRTLRPDAPVVAICSQLDLARLRQLTGMGCDLAIDRTDTADLKVAIEFLRDHEFHPHERRTLLGSILEIIREMNRFAAYQRTKTGPQSFVGAERFR